VTDAYCASLGYVTTSLICV